MYEKIFKLFCILVLSITFVYSDYVEIEYEDYDKAYTMCKNIEVNSVTLELRRHLFCDYVTDVRPVINHRNRTDIRFDIVPKFIEVDESIDTVYIHCWMLFQWDDSHLTWDPSKFSDISFLHVLSYELWKPDIVTYNSENENTEMPLTNCWVSNKGEVKCVPTNVFITKCIRDYTWWPYDAQNCTLRFASWSHSNDELRYARMYDKPPMDEFETNPEWYVEQWYEVTNVETSKFGIDATTEVISLHFILKRQHHAMHVVYVSMVVILMIMTLTTMWLEPKSVERMTLANLNFICHLLFLQSFHLKMSGTEIISSKLFKFFKISLGLACFSLILTGILRRLLELKTKTPTWIATRTSAIVQSKFGRILFISILDPKASAELETEAEDNANLVSSKKNEVSWKHFVMLLSWINFLCTLFAYIIMLIMYFPTESSGKYHKFSNI